MGSEEHRSADEGDAKITQKIVADHGGTVQNVAQIVGDVIVNVIVRGPLRVIATHREALRAARDARHRRMALQRVGARICDLLAPNDAPRISLYLRRAKGSQVGPPVLQRTPKRRDRMVASKGRLLPMFEDIGASMLILGEPGTGKTSLLLELAREAIDCAGEDHERPIPAFFFLSGWEEGTELKDWLAAELDRNYGVPRSIGSGWIRDDRLFLLLDGLDEVRSDRRPSCVAAIHRFLGERGLSPITITCRTAEYRKMPEPLALHQTVEVEALTPEQVEDYLKHSEPALARTRSLMADDPALAELASTPLMLRLISQASAGLPDDAAASLTGSAAERRAQIFDAYVENMIHYRRREPPEVVERTLDQLGWLAHHMCSSGRTLFQTEQIQPEWLDRDDNSYAGLVGLTTFALLGLWLFVGLAWEVMHGRYPSSWQDYVGLGGWLLFTLGLPSLMAFGTIRTVEVVRWSWRRGGSWFLGTVAFRGLMALEELGIFGAVFFNGLYGLAGGLAGGLLLGFRSRFAYVGATTLGGVLAGIIWGLGTWTIEVFAWPRGMLRLTLRNALESALILAPLIAFFGGLRLSELEHRTGFNVGVRRTLKNALGVATMAFFTTASVFVAMRLYSNPDLSQASLEVAQLVPCYYIAVGTFLAVGGFSTIKHYSLRLVLAAQGRLPWRLSRFLDFASSKVLLHRVGDGWAFLHPTLLEHIAARQAVPVQAPAAPAVVPTAPTEASVPSQTPAVARPRESETPDSSPAALDSLRRHWILYIFAASAAFAALDLALPDLPVAIMEFDSPAAWQVGSVSALLAGIVGRQWRFLAVGFMCGMVWGDAAATAAPLWHKYYLALVGTPLSGLLTYGLFSSVAEEIAKKRSPRESDV